jgi:transposase InsO family protein
VIASAQATLAAGGEIWWGDETTLREFPPLRASWSKRGQQAIVTISGRNARRVVHGAVQARTGELVRVVRERHRADDALVLVAALGAVRPEVPKLLVWDNAPPHKPHRVREAARAVGIQVVFLPFRAPELNPCEGLWRGLKTEVAANRAYPSVDELAERALTWLDEMSTEQRLHRCGLHSSKFKWLPT